MKITALLDEDTASGFRLAGIKDIYISNDNTNKKWDEIISRDDIGIIFITEKNAEVIKNKLNDFRLKNNIPIILEIPDKNGRIKEHIDYTSNLIKKAVGVDIVKDK